MTIELWMLLAGAMLMLALPLVYGVGFIRALGPAKMIGNRDSMPPIEGWFARLKRAHANLLENLVPFGVVVLIAQVCGVHDGATRVGAILFLVARVAHAAAYGLGMGPPRTLAYGAGLVGILMIAGAIVFGW